MKKVLVSILLMIGIAAGSSYVWAGTPDGDSSGSSTENSDNGDNNGNQQNGDENGGKKKKEMSQRERFEFMILAKIPQERPRSAGYVEMYVMGPQIVLDCYSIGQATIEVWEQGGFCIESVEINTAIEPTAYMTYPETPGQYVVKITGEDYYSEWDFEVVDGVGYIYQGVIL